MWRARQQRAEAGSRGREEHDDEEARRLLDAIGVTAAVSSTIVLWSRSISSDSKVQVSSLIGPDPAG